MGVWQRPHIATPSTMYRPRSTEAESAAPAVAFFACAAAGVLVASRANRTIEIPAKIFIVSILSSYQTNWSQHSRGQRLQIHQILRLEAISLARLQGLIVRHRPLRPAVAPQFPPH